MRSEMLTAQVRWSAWIRGVDKGEVRVVGLGLRPEGAGKGGVRWLVPDATRNPQRT